VSPTIPLDEHLTASATRLEKQRDALTKDFDPSEPRDKYGRWVRIGHLSPGDSFHVGGGSDLSTSGRVVAHDEETGGVEVELDKNTFAPLSRQRQVLQGDTPVQTKANTPVGMLTIDNGRYATDRPKATVGGTGDELKRGDVVNVHPAKGGAPWEARVHEVTRSGIKVTSTAGSGEHRQRVDSGATVSRPSGGSEQAQQGRLESWLDKVGYDPGAGDTISSAEDPDGTRHVVINLAGKGQKRKTFPR
jgi:hypothetical protein